MQEAGRETGLGVCAPVKPTNHSRSGLRSPVETQCCEARTCKANRHSIAECHRSPAQQNQATGGKVIYTNPSSHPDEPGDPQAGRQLIFLQLWRCDSRVKSYCKW